MYSIISYIIIIYFVFFKTLIKTVPVPRESLNRSSAEPSDGTDGLHGNMFSHITPSFSSSFSSFSHP